MAAMGRRQNRTHGVLPQNRNRTHGVLPQDGNRALVRSLRSGDAA